MDGKLEAPVMSSLAAGQLVELPGGRWRALQAAQRARRGTPPPRPPPRWKPLRLEEVREEGLEPTRYR